MNAEVDGALREVGAVVRAIVFTVFCLDFDDIRECFFIAEADIKTVHEVVKAIDFKE